MNAVIAHQAELFAPEKHKSIGETHRDRLWNLARSDGVMAEVLAVFRAHPGEWLRTSAELHRVKDKYDLGTYFNDTIHTLHHQGKLESRRIYFGAESPVGASRDLAGSRRLKKGETATTPYLGFRVEYRIAEAA